MKRALIYKTEIGATCITKSCTYGPCSVNEQLADVEQIEHTINKHKQVLKTKLILGLLFNCIIKICFCISTAI